MSSIQLWNILYVKVCLKGGIDSGYGTAVGFDTLICSSVPYVGHGFSSVLIIGVHP
jgi:hypothetical protein